MKIVKVDFEKIVVLIMSPLPPIYKRYKMRKRRRVWVKSDHLANFIVIVLLFFLWNGHETDIFSLHKNDIFLKSVDVRRLLSLSIQHTEFNFVFQIFSYNQITQNEVPFLNLNTEKSMIRFTKRR